VIRARHERVLLGLLNEEFVAAYWHHQLMCYDHNFFGGK